MEKIGLNARCMSQPKVITLDCSETVMDGLGIKVLSFAAKLLKFVAGFLSGNA